MSGSLQAWEVLSRETAYSCPGFDIEREDIRLPDGTRTDFDFLAQPPSVVILPFTPDGDVVLIHEWREAVKRFNRGLPAGTAEPTDRDLAAAAKRELREETGYLATSVEPLLVAEPANGCTAIEHHYFVAKKCEPAADQRLDNDETIAVDTGSFDGLLADALAGNLRDGRSLLGVLYYHATQA